MFTIRYSDEAYELVTTTIIALAHCSADLVTKPDDGPVARRVEIVGMTQEDDEEMLHLIVREWDENAGPEVEPKPDIRVPFLDVVSLTIH